MDQRPIGVFDSGLGGLTALRELRKVLPGEDLIYFGDTGRVPYGSRGRETIQRYARQDVNFLRSFDLKAIVVACGTVSANALTELRAENDIPIFGVVAPAARAAVKATRNKKVGLIGTAASIRSGAYEHEMAQMDPEVQVTALACPLFVPLVENGRFCPGDRVVELVVEEYLTPLKEAGVDTLVLGCTHYPLLSQVIGNFMGSHVALIDSGASCADMAGERLWEQGLLAERATGSCRYFVSDSTQDFARLASIFLGEPVTGTVERVDIEKY
ncbi:MAG: glutamate racemase [Oscillospiraceae bacterium]|nr:glutamate racemase [Oscillospiraceae bacterium]